MNLKFDNAFHTKNKHVGMQFNDVSQKGRKISIYPDVKGQLHIDCEHSPVSQEEGVIVVKKYNSLVRHYQ